MALTEMEKDLGSGTKKLRIGESLGVAVLTRSAVGVQTVTIDDITPPSVTGATFSHLICTISGTNNAVPLGVTLTNGQARIVYYVVTTATGGPNGTLYPVYKEN